MVARVTGREIPKGFPEKYTNDLHEVELFNASINTSIPEVVEWHKRHLDEFAPEPLSIFSDYLNAGFVIFGTLMEHPPVTKTPEEDIAAAAARFRACSVVLQRAVLISDPAPTARGATGSAPAGRQTLFLRSYMHSAEDSQRFVNFVPRGGIQMVYDSDTIWFPLELTSVIQEPVSYVVLDILTPQSLDAKQVPGPFRIEDEGRMAHAGRRYHVTRISATLDATQKWPDLRITP